jgi:hypothetical protein
MTEIHRSGPIEKVSGEAPVSHSPHIPEPVHKMMNHNTMQQLVADFPAEEFDKSMTADAKQFVGTWRLLDYTFFHDDGREEKPWGLDVIGYLLYSAEGYMSGNLSPARRTWRSRLRRLTAEVPGVTEKSEARLPTRGIPRDYIAYSGRYTVDGDTVTHHVEVSLFPNWMGLAEVRRYAFEEDRLILRTLPLRKGRSTIVAELTWQKIR